MTGFMKAVEVPCRVGCTYFGIVELEGGLKYMLHARPETPGQRTRILSSKTFKNRINNRIRFRLDVQNEIGSNRKRCLVSIFH